MITAPDSPDLRQAPEGLALRAIGVLLPLLLIAYAFGDKGFSWLHLPGTPLFVGEVVLAIGVVAIATSTPLFLDAWRGRAPLIPLFAFIAWGATLTVLGFRQYGIDTLRDSALWYYAITALLMVGLVCAQPARLKRWIDVYLKVLPWLLVWSGFVTLFGRTKVPGPLVPDSPVRLLTHKPGDVAVLASLSLAILWLVPLPDVSPRRRMVLSTMAIIVAGLAGTQTRGGFLAAGLAGLLAFVLHRARVRQLSGTIAVVVLIIGAAWATNVKIASSSDRELSVAQLIQNFSALTGSKDKSVSDDPLVGTVEFREQLWTRILTNLHRENLFMTGFGFGPNIAAQDGTNGGSLKDPDLRNPHNSHLDVLARMGVFGALMWVVLWGAWFVAVLDARTKHFRRGRPFEAGVCGVVVVGVAASLCNAFFDPALEGAPAAMWLWALFGIGVALVPRRFERATVGRASARLAS